VERRLELVGVLMSHFSSIVAALISDASAAGRSLLSAVDAAAQRTLLGLGAVTATGADAAAALAAVGGEVARVRTSGTLAALPSTPAAGDTFEVTSGTGWGRTYQCLRAGLWTRQRSQQVAMLDTPGDYTTTQPATTTITVTAGNISEVLASGSINAYSNASVAWPSGVLQYRVQFRVSLTTTDLNAANCSRTYIDYGSLNPAIMIELRGDGRLAIGLTGPYTATLIASVAQGTSAWVAVEVNGTSVRVWTCINTSDDESLCVWTLTYDGTQASHVSKGAPTALAHYAVAESRACTASVTIVVRNVTIRDLTY
jgi:hypothetical protein